MSTSRWRNTKNEQIFVIILFFFVVANSDKEAVHANAVIFGRRFREHES